MATEKPTQLCINCLAEFDPDLEACPVCGAALGGFAAQYNEPFSTHSTAAQTDRTAEPHAGRTTARSTAPHADTHAAATQTKQDAAPHAGQASQPPQQSRARKTVVAAVGIAIVATTAIAIYAWRSDGDDPDDRTQTPTTGITTPTPPPPPFTPSPEAIVPAYSPAIEASSGRGNTPSNISNNGLALEHDGRIYFSNASAGGELYSMNPDGTDARKLCDDQAEFINAVGDRLYYRSSGENYDAVYGIFTIRIDGTDRRRVGEDFALDLSIYGDRIYYTTTIPASSLPSDSPGGGVQSRNWVFYSMSLDGTDKIELGREPCDCINVAGGRIYYRDMADFHIYTSRLDGGNKVQLTDDQASQIIVMDDTIYYVNYGDGNRLYAMNPDGTDRRKLGDDPASFVNVVGDTIFYTNMNDYYKIYAMNLDGTNGWKLSDDTTWFINVAGDRLYYVSLNDGMMLRSIKTDGTDRWLIGENGAPWEWGDTADMLHGNSAGNIANGGYVAYDPHYSSGSGRVYFSNPDSGLALHAMNLDGSGITKLCDDYAAYINVVGDRLYYTNVGEGLEVYTIKTDGTDRRKLGDDSASFINVVGDTIYYVNVSIADGYPLYAMNLDGTGRRQLTVGGSSNMSQHVNAVGDMVYYVRYDTLGPVPGGQIWSVRASGRNQKQLSEVHVESLVAYGDRLYYTDLDAGLNIYSMNADGSDPRRLTDDAVICFNVAYDRIYFATGMYDEGGFHVMLHSMDVDGGDRQTILDGEESQLGFDWVWSIFVAYDRLYFTAGAIGDDGLVVALYSMDLDGGDLQMLDYREYENNAG